MSLGDCFLFLSLDFSYIPKKPGPVDNMNQIKKIIQYDIQ